MLEEGQRQHAGAQHLVHRPLQPGVERRLEHDGHHGRPPFQARRSGTIINISSIAGRKTFPNHAAYCATKFAVHALTENIREEVADVGVRMVTIAPGAVETELLSHTTDERIKAGYHDWKDQMGGVIAPEVIADAVLYAWHQPANVCVREIVLAATRQQP